MNAALGQNGHDIGEASSPPFPGYPGFSLTEPPGLLCLTGINAAGVSTKEEMVPIRVWQGIIQPFQTDQDARLALRLLAADYPIAVHGGTLLPGPKASSMECHKEEVRLTRTDFVFDVLIAEFEAPAHPWVFSLSPAIQDRPLMHHPHLRSDRTLRLRSKELPGLCLYSSAEFAFDPHLPRIPQFLNQVAIFLAKHVIWLRTQRLFGANGVMIHDGVNALTITQAMAAEAARQRGIVVPPHWIGHWPGTSALNGVDHLRLDPAGECWCGKGELYKECCLPSERARSLGIYTTSPRD